MGKQDPSLDYGMIEDYILVLGDDDHAHAVAASLRAIGKRVETMNTALPWEPVGNTLWPMLYLGKKPHGKTLSWPRALYWRSYDGCLGPTLWQTEQRASFLESWLKLAELPTHCVNGYSAWALHRTKPFQEAILYNEIQSAKQNSLWRGRIEMPVSVFGYQRVNTLATKPIQGGRTACGPNETPDEFGDGTYRQQIAVTGETYRCYATRFGAVLHRVTASTFDYRDDTKAYSYRVDDPNLIWLCDVSRWIIDVLAWNWAGIDIILGNTMAWIIDVNPSPMFLGWDHDGAIMNLLVQELLANGGKRR